MLMINNMQDYHQEEQFQQPQLCYILDNMIQVNIIPDKRTNDHYQTCKMALLTY